MKSRMFVATVVAALSLSAGCASRRPAPPAVIVKAKPAEPALRPPSDGGPDEEAMKKMMEMAQPGPEHQLLKSFEGTWAVHGKFWMGPTPTESDSTATMSMVLGGRYLRQEVRGDMGDEHFEGLGFTAFDRNHGKYLNVWMDSMGTGLMNSTGSSSADKKKLTFTGGGDWGMGPMTWREVLTVRSATEHLFEMFQTPRGGKESKVMELVYKKK